MSLPVVTLQSRVSQSSGLIGSQIGDQSVLLSITSGSYFGLDPVGSRIWELIRTPRDVSALCDSMVAEYEVERNLAQKEILSFLQKLAQAGLLQFHGS